MKLYVFPPSPRAIKVIAVRNYLQIDCELVPLDYFKGEQKTTAYAALNPNRRMPVLEDGKLVLWESNAILHYLALQKPAAGLWRKSAAEQADVLRWPFWEAAHWVPACGVLINERIKKVAFKTGEPDEKALAAGDVAVRELAQILETHLTCEPWLAGGRVSIADFSLAVWFTSAKLACYPIAEFEAIRRWYGNVRLLPGWREALPNPPHAPDFDVW